MPKLIAKMVFKCKSCPQGCYIGVPTNGLPSRKTPTKCLYNYDGLITPAKWVRIFRFRLLEYESHEEIDDFDE